MVKTKGMVAAAPTRQGIKMPETNISLKVNASELDAKLSKSMKALGVHHDEYGRLVNAQGQFVESLSQASIKMGNYIDACGRMRNANGQLMDGLTGLQKKMRNYVDDLGNIHDVTGEIIGNINKLTDSVNKVPEGIQNDGASCNDLLKELADSTSKVSVAFMSLSMDGPLKGTMKTIGEMHAKMNLFITSINEIKRVSAIFSSLKANISSVGAKQALLNTLSANYVTTMSGLASIIVVGFSKIGDQIAKNVISQDGYVDAINKTAMAFELVKDRSDIFQKSIAAIGVQSEITLKDQADQLFKNIELLQEATESGKVLQGVLQLSGGGLIAAGATVGIVFSETLIGAAVGAGIAAVGAGVAKMGDSIASDRDKAQEKLDEAQKQLADQLIDLIEQDIPKKESEKLNERLQAYKEYEKYIKERTDISDPQIQKVLKRIAEAEVSTKNKIVEAKRKELNIDKDIAQYFEESKDHALTYNEIEEKIIEAAEKNELSLKERNEAIERAKESFKVKERKELGVDSMLESIKTPNEKYIEAMENVTAAFEKGYITLEQSNKISEKLKETTGLTKEDTKGDRRSELGIDSMLESIKTPMESYRESLKKADDALREGFITEGQCTELKKKYAQETFSDVLAKLEETKTAQEKYNEAVNRAEEALREGAITEEQCTELKKQYAQDMYSDVISALEGTKTAQEKYNEAIERAKEAMAAGAITEQEKNTLVRQYKENLEKQKLQSLGVSSLLEEIKTPKEKYEEIKKNVDKAREEGLITDTQKNKMVALLKEKYFPQKEDKGEDPAKNQRPSRSLERMEERAREAPLAKSVTAGSQDLYSIIANQNKDRVEKIENRLSSFVNLFRDYSNKFETFMANQSDMQFAVLG